MILVLAVVVILAMEALVSKKQQEKKQKNAILSLPLFFPFFFLILATGLRITSFAFD